MQSVRLLTTPMASRIPVLIRAVGLSIKVACICPHLVDASSQEFGAYDQIPTFPIWCPILVVLRVQFVHALLVHHLDYSFPTLKCPLASAGMTCSSLVGLIGIWPSGNTLRALAAISSTCSLVWKVVMQFELDTCGLMLPSLV